MKTQLIWKYLNKKIITTARIIHFTSLTVSINGIINIAGKRKNHSDLPLPPSQLLLHQVKREWMVFSQFLASGTLTEHMWSVLPTLRLRSIKD